MISASIRSGRSDLRAVDSARRLLDLGFERLVLSPGLRAPEWEALVEFLPPGALIACPVFVPSPTRIGGPGDRPPRLGSLDAHEQREARKRGCQTLESLDRAGIDTMLIDPVALLEPDRAAVNTCLESRHFPVARDRLLERRSLSAPRHLDSLLGSLDAFLETAARYERRVALCLAGLPSEMPSRSELETIEREFSGAPLEVALDMVRVERARLFTPGQAEGAETGEAERSESETARPPWSPWSPFTGDGTDGPVTELALWGVRVHDGDAIRAGLALGEAAVSIESWSSGPEELRTRAHWFVDLATSAGEASIRDTRVRLEELLEGQEVQAPKRDTGAPPRLDSFLGDLV